LLSYCNEINAFVAEQGAGVGLLDEGDAMTTRQQRLC